MPEALKDASIKKLAPRRDRYEVADEDAPGLRLRVYPNGTRTWSYWYRAKSGDTARVKLGKYPGLSLSEARKLAKDYAVQVDKGKHPQKEKKAARKKVDRDAKTTIGALARSCVEKLTLRPSTRKEWGRLAEADIIPAFGKVQAADLTRAEIREWSESIRDGQRSWRDDGGRAAPYTANRAFELLRRIFSWAVSRDLVAGTPFAGLELPANEEQSECVLSRDELRAVLLALDARPRELEVYRELWDIYADAARLLLLTCVRRAAVLGMRRSELEDLDGKDPRWIVPGGADGRSKSGRAHVVPLSPHAVTIVERRIAAVDGDCLFPVNRYQAGEDRPATWPSRFVKHLRAESENQLRKTLSKDASMPKWRIHDFRHTIATHLRESFGVSSEVVSLLLSHTPAGPRVTRVYDRSTLLPERRAALVAWGAWLEKLKADEKRAADVLPMAGRA